METKISVKLDDMSFDELVTLMRGLCNEANKLREQIRYVQGKIEARAALMAPKLRLASIDGEVIEGVEKRALR